MSSPGKYIDHTGHHALPQIETSCKKYFGT